ncbi:DUF5324 family protein [Streptomyces sp. XD-27]|uniref:DUF5324 family protein n=1 Tax=Streptomyces sp. XD-27 TaxID=3062779 RepID=UPI0026F430CC|nr:DUF5324 family protein [Streptomyces sp. XD-27]WKX71479.1 DUF5324 family protein [Streptomyces sp. XD-27]
MTRTDSVRAATGTAKDSVLHAAEVVAPYAGTAKEAAAHYAHHARVRLGPKVSHAAHRAGATTAAWYHGPVARQVEHARGALPPKVDAAATRAATRTRKAARHAADYTAPRVEHAVAATRAVAQPAREEAMARGTAALAALRGQVTAAEITRIAKHRARRARTRRAFKRFTAGGLLAGGAYAAWKWWDKQANPDWLVEPPAPTELAEGQQLTSVDGSGPEGGAPDERSGRESPERREKGDQP